MMPPLEQSRFYRPYQIARQIVGVPVLGNVREMTTDQLRTAFTERRTHGIAASTFALISGTASGIVPNLYEKFHLVSPEIATDMRYVLGAFAIRAILEGATNLLQVVTVNNEFDRRQGNH